VENVLYQLKEVRDAAVIGVEDALLGQAIKAFVVLNQGAQLSPKEILAHCSKHLEKFMVPQYVEIVADLPKTTTGKIKKTDLK
jgi:acyl-coenzyme A synthetase/AMP-(fatty) acid ligase